ncbi:uncharacterized protein BYT42DRAFT_475955, partial [Radiomyces spectabilis]|uniref:uncharacterized protein n=1 Tax=Radiomyces spectabilis TaxID=64574 RepID=UPI00221FBA1A
SNIRIKTSESTYAYTTQRKVEQYPEAKNVVGFKIDVRFLLDRNGKEYDWCSGEMARLDDADKAMTDKAKLNRESKDDLDYMLELCSDNDLVGCTAWQFQSAGSCGNICSINLANNGLYVAL